MLNFVRLAENLGGGVRKIICDNTNVQHLVSYLKTLDDIDNYIVMEFHSAEPTPRTHAAQTYLTRHQHLILSVGTKKMWPRSLNRPKSLKSVVKIVEISARSIVVDSGGRSVTGPVEWVPYLVDARNG